MRFGKNVVIVGADQLLRIAPELDSLRARLGLENDLSTDIDHLFSLNDHKSRRPVTVLFYNDESELAGTVIFFEKRLYGVPTGVLRAGDHAGDGAVIAPPGRRREMLICAVELILEDWRFHSIFGAVSHAADESPLSLNNPEISKSVTSRIVSRRMTLGDGYEETLKSFCRKRRQDVRSKRRRFNHRKDVEWVAELNPEEAREAMLYLTEHCFPRRTQWEINRRYEFLRKHPGSAFAVGIRRTTGQWMSFITGWRASGVTYVSWAMHDRRYLSDSLGTVIYSFLIEHETALKQNFVEWVGGVTERWTAVCVPEECFCITRIRPGFRPALIQWLADKLQMRTALGYYQSELNTGSDEAMPESELEVPPELAPTITLPGRSLTTIVR